MLSGIGSVVGIDVGFSPTKRSSAICRLHWDSEVVAWSLRRFRATDEDRRAAIEDIMKASKPLAAAIDGPLMRGFPIIGRYRAAERMLTRRLQPHIGKPGQSSAPVGRALNHHANLCAQVLLDACEVGPAAHPQAIHQRAIVEAFPSSYLGMLLTEPKTVSAARKDRSDVFFAALAADGTLPRLLAYLLPGRRIGDVTSIKNHDDRAAFICALTALSVAAGDYTAVGDDDGWIILPPVAFVVPWARELLIANESDDETGRFVICKSNLGDRVT